MSVNSSSGHNVGSHSLSPPQSAQPYQSIFGPPIESEAGPSNYRGPRDDSDSYDDQQIDPALNELPEGFGEDSDDPSYFEAEEDNALSDGEEEYLDETPTTKNSKGKGVLRDNHLSQAPPPSSPPPRPSYRPNRYNGPPATWRLWTKSERQLIEGLEELRSRDLSAHLFNAFALKKRAQALTDKSTGNSGEYQETIAGISVPTFAFVPNKSWTAWPLPPSLVPRTHETNTQDEDDAWTFRSLPDPRPSGVLEELLIANMMNTAKNRFREREWESTKIERMPTEHANDEPMEDENPYKSESEESTSKGNRPVIQTDEILAKRQLRPLARNIITKFDRLLFGLHAARKASVAAEDSSATDTDTEIESVKSTMSSHRKRRFTNASLTSQSRGRKRQRTTFPASSEKGSGTEHQAKSQDSVSTKQIGDEIDSEGISTDIERSSSEVSSPSSRSRGHRRRSSRSYRKKNLGLRDWSEVLGLAALTDCPNAAVMRASKRCADLFGEDMAFATLEEGHVERVVDEETDRKWLYVDNSVELPGELVPQRSHLYQHGESGPKSVLKRRSSKGNLTHPEDTKGAESEAGSQYLVERSHRLKGKGRHRRRDLVCPVEDCLRHLQGFSRRWNLNLHLKRIHPDLVNTSSGKAKYIGPENTSEVDIDTN